MEKLNDEQLENVSGGAGLDVYCDELTGYAQCPYDSYPMKNLGYGGYKNRYIIYKCGMCYKKFLKSRIDSTWSEMVE